MGRDKASLLLGGRTLAQRSLDRMLLLTKDVSFCGPQPGLPAAVPTLQDSLPDEGPLVPLVQALEDAQRAGMDILAAVCAVDLPLLPWQMLEWLLRRAQMTGALATIPIVGDRPQPLCAIYSASLAAGLRQQLDKGERKLMRAVEAACDPARLDLFDLATVMPGRKEHLAAWFMNVNTPLDAAAAEEQMQRRIFW